MEEQENRKLILVSLAVLIGIVVFGLVNQARAADITNLFELWTINTNTSTLDGDYEQKNDIDASVGNVYTHIALLR